jgi:hypothetical protein
VSYCYAKKGVDFLVVLRRFVSLFPLAFFLLVAVAVLLSVRAAVGGGFSAVAGRVLAAASAVVRPLSSPALVFLSLLRCRLLVLRSCRLCSRCSARLLRVGCSAGCRLSSLWRGAVVLGGVLLTAFGVLGGGFRRRSDAES